MTPDPNSPDSFDALLLPYVAAMTPVQEKELGELMTRPIIDWYLWIDESGKVHYAGEVDADAGGEQ